VGDSKRMGALQNLQSFEIDNRGRMWLLDVGRLYFFSNDPKMARNDAPPRLVIYDLHAIKVLHTFVFPNEIADYKSSWLNDLAVDSTRGVAYITDTSGDGGLIVYDWKTNRARRFTGPSTKSEKGISTGAPFHIAGVDYDIDGPSDGVALSPQLDTVYYCPVRGKTLYSLPARGLRNFALTNDQLNSQVTKIAVKTSQTDGMAMDSNGVLYYGLLSQAALGMWDTSKPYSTATIPLHGTDPSKITPLDWIDTFGFDQSTQSLVFTANHLELWFTNKMDFTGKGPGSPQIRIYRMPIHSDSYATYQPR